MASVERFYPPDDVTCHFCDMRLSSRIKLGEHYTSAHGVALVWRCSSCHSRTYLLSTSMSGHYTKCRRRQRACPPPGPWSEADLRVLACRELQLPPRTKFVNQELAKGYDGLQWQTIKDCRAKKLYRGVLCQEQARMRSAAPATTLPVSTLPTRSPFSSPVKVRQKHHIQTTQLSSSTTPCRNRPSPTPTALNTSPEGTEQYHEHDDRPWTAEDTRALALSELQAPTAMVCDEELAALLPRRSRESVREHRR
ncbi:unnamed protein product, partial [Ixodes hexagonus]